MFLNRQSTPLRVEDKELKYDLVVLYRIKL